MPTNVGAASGVSAVGAVQPQADRGLQGLRSEDFFRILVTELQQQDPLEPSKTSDMIGQVADIRSIELNTQLSEALQQLVRQQRTAGLSEYLGKFVAATGTSAGGPSVVSGVVAGVRFLPDGVALLDLDNGQAVRASDVVFVTTLEQAAQSLTEHPVLGEQVKAATARTSNKPGPLDWLRPENWLPRRTA
ncbi:MAG TPA: flagellar hook capping FlgD N-terminal domain-containing protein [Phycisphaerae bacterium]|nr:flagellar hook capping FlgD N-terminal domain-containing protein [Phycisphaerae bacterium]